MPSLTKQQHTFTPDTTAAWLSCIDIGDATEATGQPKQDKQSLIKQFKSSAIHLQLVCILLVAPPQAGTPLLASLGLLLCPLLKGCECRVSRQMQLQVHSPPLQLQPAPLPVEQTTHVMPTVQAGVTMVQAVPGSNVIGCHYVVITLHAGMVIVLHGHYITHIAWLLQPVGAWCHEAAHRQCFDRHNLPESAARHSNMSASACMCICAHL